MKTTIVGRLILQERMKKNIFQNDLCYGVCNRTTLSRIENGEIIPSYALACVLFTRLGKSIPKNLIPLRENERNIYNVDFRLGQLCDNRDERREEWLKEYKKYINEKDFLNRQRYLLYLGITKKKIIETFEESLVIHEKALKLTQPDFSLNNKEMPKGLLSATELSLLRCIAHTEYYIYDSNRIDFERKNSALKRIFFLKEYFENHIENYKSNSVYSSVNFCLSSWLGLDGKYTDALKIAEGYVINNPDSLYFLSHELYDMGFSQACLEQKVKARKTLNDAFVLVNMYDEFNEVEYYVKRTDEIFHFDPPLDSKTFL